MQGNQDLSWLYNALGMGGGLGALGGGLFGLMSPGKNPADAANKYISQIPGQTQQYFQPYINAGQNALGGLQDQYGQLVGNTGDVYNRLGAGYKESPGYQFQLKQALNAANNASAAGGMLGTPAHEQQNMDVAQGLASRDYENYLNHVLGLYGSGLGGQQNLAQMGQQAGSNYADTLANALSQQAGYGYAGQAGKNAARSQNIGNIFSGLGMFAPFLGGLFK